MKLFVMQDAYGLLTHSSKMSTLHALLFEPFDCSGLLFFLCKQTDAGFSAKKRNFFLGVLPNKEARRQEALKGITGAANFIAMLWMFYLSC